MLGLNLICVNESDPRQSHGLCFCISITAEEMKASHSTLSVVAALSVVPYVMFSTEAHCHSFDLYVPPVGRYCEAEGSALPHMAFHQCNLICLQCENCTAVNLTDDKRTFLYNPFPLAHEAPGMEYFVFTKTPIQQCSQWIPYTSREALDERMIASEIGAQMESCIKYKGYYIIGYEFIPYGQCFTFRSQLLLHV